MSLNVVYVPADEVEPRIDFVAVHGLNFLGTANHGTSTWKKGDKLWIRDFLPGTLAVPVRVLLYEYNASPAVGAAATKLDDHAAKLLLLLDQKRRRDIARRPLVFIAHSLGGLLVKEALVEATLDDSYASILKATKLVVFFGTPHRGGNHATTGDFVAKSYKVISRNPRNDLVDALCQASNAATKRYEQFRHKLEDFQIISCYETIEYNKVAGIIVEKESATLGLPGKRELQIAIDANHSDMCKFSSAVGDCEAVMIAIDQKLEVILTTSSDPLVQELLERLDFPNKRARQSQIRSTLRHEETFEWIWSSPFAAWLTTERKLFWIRGKPASGKSALVNYITESQRLEDQLMKIGRTCKISVTTHYFDFRQGSTLANNAKGMLLTILHSMLLQNLDLVEILRSSFPDAHNVYQDGEWDLIQLQEVVKLASSRIPQSVYIFLDGFDEFSGNTEEQLDLVHYILSLSSHENFHLCIVSRPHLLLQKVFHSIDFLDMQDWNLPGLTSYIHKAFDKIGFVQQNVHSSEVDHLSELMATMAEGVFLWANFAVEAVIELWTQEQLEFSPLLLRLAQLPHDVESLWERRFAIMNNSERALGICLIQLVCSAARPLMMTELLYMARRQNTSDFDSLLSNKKPPESGQAIVHLSAGLLEIKPFYSSGDLSSQAVLIVHKSVRSYVDSKGIWLSSESSNVPEQIWLEACTEAIGQATFARERSLCYQNKTHDKSNAVCRAHGCYGSYPPGQFPRNLYKEIYESITRYMALEFASASLQRTYATEPYNLATLANALFRTGMSRFWPRNRRPTFLKQCDSDATYLLAYSLHWLLYHSWILDRRRNVSDMSFTNSLMCPELIILMTRSNYYSCAFCTDVTTRVETNPMLEFHGSDHRLFAHSRGDAFSDNTGGGETDTFAAVTENDLLHQRVYRMFAYGYNSSMTYAQSSLLNEIQLSRTFTGGSQDICIMDLARPPERQESASNDRLDNHFIQGVPKSRKIAIVGPRGSGKSSLIVQFVDGHYVDSYYPTIGNTFSKLIRYKGQDYLTEIVDSAGQDEYSILNSKHFIGIHGYIIVYSVESRSGFEMTRIIYDKILNHLGVERIPCVIVGNKCGTSKRLVSLLEGQSLAKELGCAFIEADPRWDVNVSAAFKLMIAEVEKSNVDLSKDSRQHSSKCIVQ